MYDFQPFFYSFMCRYPAKEVLHHVHREHLQWNHFKSLLVNNVVEVIDDRAFAMKPCFTKGHSGWLKPPAKTLQDIDTRFKECMSSEIPLCYHRLSKGCHLGPCIMESIMTDTLLINDTRRLTVCPT